MFAFTKAIVENGFILNRQRVADAKFGSTNFYTPGEWSLVSLRAHLAAACGWHRPVKRQRLMQWWIQGEIQ